MKRKHLYLTLPFLGILLCLWYVKEATYDVVYSDYIRLVNTYLPDVWNPDKFFVPDVLTRIPINYASRMINVTFFGFCTTFDMTLGVLGLGLAGFVLAIYCSNQKLRFPWFFLAMMLMFSLNKWEMLTNGTGWAHFLAFACFYYHYLVLDRVQSGDEKRFDSVRLILLPFAITLGVAGPYCAIYSVTLLLAYGYVFLKEQHSRSRRRNNKRYLIYAVSVLIPLALYIWSNSYAVEDHAGAVDVPFLATVLTNPLFFLKFFLKSFATMILGAEQIAKLRISNQVIYLMGGGVILSYLIALWLNVRYRLYEKTIFPMMLLVAGGLNHLLILASRWIFLKEDYGMSSRYALQYQVGVIGIVLTIGLLWEELESVIGKSIVAMCCAVFLLGNLYTSQQECQMAPHRENYGADIAAVAVEFEHLDDKLLRETFDYRESLPDSGVKVRNALTILKKHNWNVYRTQSSRKIEAIQAE